MGRIGTVIRDKRMLRLIGRYLRRGALVDGLLEASVEGTPQGGPLSPLLANIYLDPLDKELEKRGHKFCRYADDCNIYVGSLKAGERVLKSVGCFLTERLRLKINPVKSGVDRPWKRKFLGFTLTPQRESRVNVAPQSIQRFKQKMRAKFREGRGRNLRTFLEGLKPLLRGWANYFSVAQTRAAFEQLDEWIRRKLRCLEWRKWKRRATRMKRLIALGLERERARASAFNGHGPWWNAGASHMNAALPTSYFRRMGLILILEEVNWQTALRKQRVCNEPP
jgi:RNA-directed DNA polymerase